MNAIVPTSQSTAVATQSPDHSGATLYRVSTEAAALCRDIVLATSSNIQGRKYVAVEGWMAIALAHGCAASSGNVIRHDDGSVSATGRVVRIDTGTLISSAEGYVGADEQTWFGGKNAYGKMLPKRADYAIRAMAQTRAISRACRSAFAHVVVMMNAGLSTTPAEEMSDDRTYDAEASPAPSVEAYAAPRPAPAAPAAERKRTVREIVRDKLVGCTRLDEVAAVRALPSVLHAKKEAPVAIWQEIAQQLDAALLRVLRETLADARREDDVHAVAALPIVSQALTEAPESVRDEIGALLSEALDRVKGETVAEEVG